MKKIILENGRIICCRDYSAYRRAIDYLWGKRKTHLVKYVETLLPLERAIV